MDRIEELDQTNSTKGNFLTMVAELEQAIKESFLEIFKRYHVKCFLVIDAF